MGTSSNFILLIRLQLIYTVYELCINLLRGTLLYKQVLDSLAYLVTPFFLPEDTEMCFFGGSYWRLAGILYHTVILFVTPIIPQGVRIANKTAKEAEQGVATAHHRVRSVLPLMTDT